MKKNIVLKRAIVLAVLFFPSIFGNATALPLDKLRIVKISVSDGTAIISLQNSNLRIIGLGDELAGIGKVVEISENRIVFEAKSGAEKKRKKSLSGRKTESSGSRG